MEHIINIKPGMTLRELIQTLERGFWQYMDTPLTAIDTICDEYCWCEPCSYGKVAQLKIKLSDGLELRIYHEQGIITKDIHAMSTNTKGELEMSTFETQDINSDPTPKSGEGLDALVEQLADV